MLCQLKTGLALVCIVSVLCALGCKSEPAAPAKKAETTPPAKGTPSSPEKSAAMTGPKLNDVQWTELATADFAGNEKREASFMWDVPGVAWDVVNETGRVKGTTTDNSWQGTRINLPVTGDENDFVEVSGEFKVSTADGHHLVALFGQDGKLHAESLCMLFESKAGDGGQYRIQTEWAQHQAELVDGKATLPGFGDENQRFHKMRMVLDRAQSKVYYFVDDVYIGTVQVDGRVAPIDNVQMDFESSQAGTNIEILYDNLMARAGRR